MIQYFIDIILVRFPDPLVQSESGNLTIKPSPYLAGPSLHFTLLSCLLSIVLIFICPVSSPTPFCPISLFDFPYRAFWFVLSQLFHPFSSAGPWPIFSGQSPLLKSRSRSGHLSVFSAFKRRWWREWRQSKVDHGAITVKEELVWWNTGDVSFCWTKWHHINQMLPKKMKGILEETTTRLNWGHLPSSNTTSTICLKILHSTIHGKGTMSHMIRCRSISTVGGSGATCTRNFFEFFFFKTGDLSMVQLTQKIQKNSKKWRKKTPKMHWHHTTQMVMETLVTSG